MWPRRLAARRGPGREEATRAWSSGRATRCSRPAPTCRPCCRPSWSRGVGAIEGAEADLQNVMLKLRYATVPVVSGDSRYGAGWRLRSGGATRPSVSPRWKATSAWWKSVWAWCPAPAAWPTSRAARRENAGASTNKDILPFLTEGFTAAAMAKVGTSAIESRKIGYLLDGDLDRAEQGRAAVRRAATRPRRMFNAGYRPPHKRQFPVVGRSGKATIKGQLVNMRDGGFISPHDFHIAEPDRECGHAAATSMPARW